VRPDARDAVVTEVVGEEAVAPHLLGDDGAPEVVVALARRVLAQHVDQDLGREHVVAHRGERRARVARHRLGRARLLDEGVDAAVRRRGHDAEVRGLGERHRAGRHRDVGAAREVELDHVAEVHAVDVVGAEDRDQLGAEVADQVEILEDGVGRAPVPALATAHLRRDDGDERLRQPAADAPGAAHVLDERLRLVLHQHVERVDARVDEVAEHVVDDAVARAEGHRGLAARARERLQAVTPPSRHHDPEHAGHGRQ